LTTDCRRIRVVAILRQLFGGQAEVVAAADDVDSHRGAVNPFSIRTETIVRAVEVVACEAQIAGAGRVVLKNWLRTGWEAVPGEGSLGTWN
jgi:hypothetical protein